MYIYVVRRELGSAKCVGFSANINVYLQVLVINNLNIFCQNISPSLCQTPVPTHHHKSLIYQNFFLSEGFVKGGLGLVHNWNRWLSIEVPLKINILVQTLH